MPSLLILSFRLSVSYFIRDSLLTLSVSLFVQTSDFRPRPFSASMQDDGPYNQAPLVRSELSKTVEGTHEAALEKRFMSE